MRQLCDVMPDGVKVTVLADRGFASCRLMTLLKEELGFEYVIRLRGNYYVTNARGERARRRSGWARADGRARYGMRR